MTVPLVVHGPGNVHGDSRLERRGLPGVQEFRWNPKCPGARRSVRFFRESGRRFAEDEQAALHQTEVILLRGESLERRAARELQIAQQWSRALRHAGRVLACQKRNPQVNKSQSAAAGYKMATPDSTSISTRARPCPARPAE